MTVVKPSKGGKLASLMNQTTAKQEDLIIPFIDAYLERCNNTGTYKVVNEFKPDDKYFHPSQDTMKCKRCLFFEKSPRFKVPPEVYSATTIRTFHIGQAVHSLVQQWVKKMGDLPGFPHSVQGPEVKALNEALNIRGSVDDIIEFPSTNEYVLEVKTMNSAQFSMLKAPLPAHQLQGKVYCHILGIDKVKFLYVQKDFPHSMKEFTLDKGDISPVLSRWGKVQEALIADDCSFLEWECRKDDSTWNKCPCREFCRSAER